MSRPKKPRAREPAESLPDVAALANYVRQGRCALFVGAGLSVGAGLPTWNVLIERIAHEAAPFALDPRTLKRMEGLAAGLREKAPDVINPLSQVGVQNFFAKLLGPSLARELFDPTSALGGIDLTNVYAYSLALERVRADTKRAADLGELRSAGKLPELAGFCRDLLGRSRFHEILRRELRPKNAVTSLHESIVRTPYACVVTTNFDTLLEDAYARWDPRGVPQAPTGAELAQHGTLLFDDSFFVLKAHGDIDDEASLVFTRDDYRRVIHSNPAFQAMLTGVLLRRAVLFVGYSLSDVNFRLLLDNQLTIFNESVPPRYAVLEGVGEAEQEVLWRTARIRVLSYPKGEHSFVERLLSELASRTRVRETAPTKRARREAPRSSVAPLDVSRSVVLAIHAHGERLALELRDASAQGDRKVRWSGGCAWPDWTALQAGVASCVSDSFAGFAQLSDLNRIGAFLRDSLPQSLMTQIDALDDRVPILLSLSPQTQTTPWEWLIVEGSPLCLRHPLVRRPTSVSDKARGLTLARSPLRALVVGDAGAGDGSSSVVLKGAAREAKQISQLLRSRGGQVTCLEREDAVYERFVEEVELGDYDVVHFAGHAWYETSDAHLYFWDGRVTGAELASILNRRPPALLVLNSHYTAFVPCGVADSGSRGPSSANAPGVDRPLTPALGFMDVAMHSGVGAFVGSFAGMIPDESAGNFAIELFSKLLDGESFASALSRARVKTVKTDDVTGLYYAGAGHPGLRLAARTTR